MQSFLLVFIGGGIGSALRYGTGNLITKFCGTAFSYGTLAINISGSFLLGLLVGWLALKGEQENSLRLLLAVGALGGFTTFSTFTLEALMLWERQQVFWALMYVTLSVALGLCGMIAGLWLGRTLF